MVIGAPGTHWVAVVFTVVSVGPYMLMTSATPSSSSCLARVCGKASVVSVWKMAAS